MSPPAQTALDQLARRFKRTGDRQALGDLASFTAPRLRAIARRIAGAGRAEDVVQATFLALTRRGTLPADAPVWAWLVTTTIRIAYRQRAKERRMPSTPLADLAISEHETPTRRAMRREQVDDTRAAIAGLPTHYRDVIVLHHLEGYRVAEVAQLLDVPKQTVKTRLRRARALLRTSAGVRRPGWALLPAMHLGDVFKRVAAIGGVMKANTAVVATVVLLGAVGVRYVIGGMRAEPEAAQTPQPESTPEDPTPGLTPRPAEEPAEKPAEAPSTTQPETRPPVVPPRPQVSPAEQRERIADGARKYAESMTLPEVVVKEAEALGVSDEALREMYKVEYLLHFAGRERSNEALADVTQAALDAWSRSGEAAFLALAANVRGNPGNFSAVDAMARAAWQPGFEKHITEWLSAQPATRTVPAPIRALGGIDTADTRTYLNDLLPKYDHSATNFVTASLALGRLGDGASAKAVAAKLSNYNWSGLHGSILDSLGGMGGSAAREALRTFVRDPKRGIKGRALTALARIDAGEARAEAKALLDGVRGRLNPGQQADIERFLAAQK